MKRKFISPILISLKFSIIPPHSKPDLTSGTSSLNPKGWGVRTSGWKTKGDGRVPNNYRNQ